MNLVALKPDLQDFPLLPLPIDIFLGLTATSSPNTGISSSLSEVTWASK